MSEAFQPPVRFPNLRLRVNLFLVFAALLLLGFVGLVAYKQGWFVHQTNIRFVTGDALGITKGMPVKLFGYTIGSVKEMDLAFEGVEVHLAIISEHMPRIVQGSKARFARESGVIGASVIEIVPGKSQAPPLREGERIVFERSRGISEIVEEFRRQAEPALNELKQTFAQINRSTSDAAATVQALRRAAENADRSFTQVSRQTVTTLSSMQRAADQIERAAPQLAGKMSTTLDSIGGAAVQLRQTGEEAQETLRRVRPALDHGETAAREASEVFSAAKRVWPLADSFKEAPDATLPIDSFEARPAGAR